MGHIIFVFVNVYIIVDKNQLIDSHTPKYSNLNDYMRIYVFTENTCVCFLIKD